MIVLWNAKLRLYAVLEPTLVRAHQVKHVLLVRILLHVMESLKIYYLRVQLMRMMLKRAHHMRIAMQKAVCADNLI